MSSSWIRTALKYALLLTPIAVLIGLIGLLGVGTWVAAILDKPGRMADAPLLVRKVARAIYSRTRIPWQTSATCAVFDPELLYKPRPGICEFNNIEFATKMNFDQRGIRFTSAPRELAGPVHRPRLVIIGDSHAMGWGVEDNETFASVLASRYGFATHNLAVSSYATPRELRRLERDFELKPDDIIVIQYCDNDLGENRHFLTTKRVGPYEPGRLADLQNYRPTTPGALPIAGLVLRLLWQDFLDWLPGGAYSGRASPDDLLPGRNAAKTLVGVLSHFPTLTRNRIVIVAINGPANETHLSADKRQIETAGISMLVPTLGPEDFFDIDDHMRAQGHAKVADQLADLLRAQAPSQ